VFVDLGEDERNSLLKEKEEGEEQKEDGHYFEIHQFLLHLQSHIHNMIPTWLSLFVFLLLLLLSSVCQSEEE
jgi:hypothetical protein